MTFLGFLIVSVLVLCTRLDIKYLDALKATQKSQHLLLYCFEKKELPQKSHDYKKKYFPKKNPTKRASASESASVAAWDAVVDDAFVTDASGHARVYRSTVKADLNSSPV